MYARDTPESPLKITLKYGDRIMITAKKLTGLAMATAAAGLFLATPLAMADKAAGKVQCVGVNACKGKSACGTAEHACKGQNACKGKGWLEMSKEECEKKGGTVKES
jgi:hypothetical protein